MATLTGSNPASTYKDLLQVSNSNSGIDGTKRTVDDGEGTASPLELSSSAVNISSGFELAGSAVDSSATELNYNNITTLGTQQASKVVTADASNIINSFESTGIDDNATETAITIDSDENVGIGTDSPDSLLELLATENTVYDASEASHQRSEGTTLQIDNHSSTVGSFAQILLRNRSSGVGGCRIVSISNGTDSSDLAIVTGDTTEALRIDSSGNVDVASGTLTAPKFSTSEGSFTATANTTTTQVISGLSSYTSYLVSAYCTEVANHILSTTYLVICANPNLRVAVFEIGTGDYSLGSIAIQNKGNGVNYSYSAGNGNAFQIVVVNDHATLDMTCTYNIIKIGA